MGIALEVVTKHREDKNLWQRGGRHTLGCIVYNRKSKSFLEMWISRKYTHLHSTALYAR